MAPNFREPRTRGGITEPPGYSPYWVVVRLSRHDAVAQNFDPNNWRRLFRHPSEESAATEALRLAVLSPGKRFTVFAAGASFKIDAVAVAA